MAGADTSTFSTILKEDYKDPIVDVLNSKTLLLSRIQRNTEDVVGKRAYLPFNISRNEGVGARAEGGTLPTAGQQGYNDATFNMTYHYGRIKVTGPVIAAAASDTGAFTRAVESETKGMVRDLLKDQNRQLFQDGTGFLAARASGGAAAQATIVVDSIQHLRVGMVLDLMEATGSATVPTALTNNTGKTIASIARSTKTITFSQNIGTATTSSTRLVRQGSISKEMYGLDAIFKQTSGLLNVNITNGVPNFGAIDHTDAANEWYLANGLFHTTPGTNRPFSFDLIDEAKDVVDIEGDGEISIWLTNHAIYRRAAKQLLPDRRYATQDGKVGKLDGGYDALDYNGVPLCRDRDCQDNRIYGLDEETIMLFEMTDWDWMDKDGDVLSRVDGEDAYEATMFKYQQLGCSDKKNNICIFDVAHT